MSCGLCHKPERGADEKKDYLCGLCVIKLTSMDKTQRRVYVDTLYSQGRDGEAEFVETFFEGRINKPISIKTTDKPKLLIRRNGKI